MGHNDSRMGNMKESPLAVVCWVGSWFNQIPKQHRWILEQIPKEWEKLNR